MGVAFLPNRLCALIWGEKVLMWVSPIILLLCGETMEDVRTEPNLINKIRLVITFDGKHAFGRLKITQELIRQHKTRIFIKMLSVDRSFSFQIS